MGLLDDAIRDHLDLQRRRGADPTEVERAEREALGPVRRAPVEPAEGELELAPLDEQEVEYELEYEEEYAPDERESERAGWSDDPFDEATRVHTPLAPEPDEPDPFASGPFADEAPAPVPAAHEPRASAPSEPLAPEVPPPPADEREPASELSDRDQHTGEETVEYDVEDALEPDRKGGEKSEDVLEETPEFLQDTPDHDRLWFEQKPPKDFDFDG
jgi:hypothetical protein